MALQALEGHAYATLYTQYIQAHLHTTFPNLVSYHRFVDLIPRALGPLMVNLTTLNGSYPDSALLSDQKSRKSYSFPGTLGATAGGLAASCG